MAAAGVGATWLGPGPPGGSVESAVLVKAFAVFRSRSCGMSWVRCAGRPIDVARIGNMPRRKSPNMGLTVPWLPKPECKYDLVALRLLVEDNYNHVIGIDAPTSTHLSRKVVS